MKNARQVALVASILITSISLLSAKKKQQTVEHAPLPAKVMTAKTIFIQNDSGYAEMADTAYTQLKAWGKYQIVDAKEKADLVLVLAITTRESAGTSPGWVSLHNSETGSWTNGTVSSPSTSTLHFTQIRLINAATGDTAWADQRLWRRKRPGTEELIRALRQRVEEQEKPPK